MFYHILLPALGDASRVFIALLGIIYLIVLLLLALYGVSNFINTILYLRVKKTLKRKQEAPPPSEWPAVTIQLPIYNEKYTVERLLHAVTQLEYPADRLQIQVLDDSTDDTAELVSRLVDEYKDQGLNIEWLHRTNRSGYKAGALGEALSRATGEFIGIFDADFVPKPDWLKKTIPLFQNWKL